MDERKAFEAWLYPPLRNPYERYAIREEELAWRAWQAATAAERERAAKVCERERMVRGGEVFAAEIRKG